MGAWFADVMVVIGLLVMTIGVIGIYRMPNVYLQLHGSSKAVFLGVISFIVASFPSSDGDVIARGVLIIVFVLVTTPISTHLIARSADLAGQGPDRRE